jgi:hypothetical protein
MDMPLFPSCVIGFPLNKSNYIQRDEDGVGQL